MSRPSNCNNRSSLAPFPGLVSHDRELISSLATRIIELTPEGIVDYHGSYEEYLERQGIV